MTRWLVGCALCAGILVGCSDSDSGEAGGEGGASGQCSGQVSGSCVYTVNCIEYYGVDYAEIESRCTIGTPSTSACATAGAVGGCHLQSFDGSCSVTVDYQSFSNRNDAAQICDGSGGEFVDP